MLANPTIDEVNVILVDLDVILDTRIGVLSQLYPAATEKLINNPLYRTRQTDEFNLIDKSIDLNTYRKAYANRDVNALMNAVPTEMMLEFVMILDSLLDEILGPNPENKIIKVEINTAPYNLTSEECESIVHCFRTHTMTPFEITTVNIPYENMSLRMLEHGDYAALFIYDFDLFQYSVFTKNFKETDKPLPQVTVMVPRICASLEKYEEASKEKLPNGDPLEPFEFLRLHYGKLLAFQFLGADRFSAFTPT